MIEANVIKPGRAVLGFCVGLAVGTENKQRKYC